MPDDVGKPGATPAPCDEVPNSVCHQLAHGGFKARHVTKVRWCAKGQLTHTPLVPDAYTLRKLHTINANRHSPFAIWQPNQRKLATTLCKLAYAG